MISNEIIDIAFKTVLWISTIIYSTIIIHIIYNKIKTKAISGRHIKEIIK